MPTLFEDEVKARCPDCNQPLTFVRTRSHQKRWYCYGCEKFIDHFPETIFIKDSHAGLEALSGLQVIDSHGILVGRVRKAIPSSTGDIGSLLLSVDKEQFKTLLDDRDLPREYEVGHDKIATVGDVVILSDVFSLSALAPVKSTETLSGVGWCLKCGAQLLPGAKHCIKCGSALNSNSCTSCGMSNPVDAKFCKNCGNKMH